MVEKMDANHDGKVTAAEMEAARAAMPTKGGGHNMSTAEKIRMIDTDKDGTLSASEQSAGITEEVQEDGCRSEATEGRSPTTL